MLTILICKILGFLGSLIGRGSSLPGAVALKLNKNILDKLTLPPVVVAVTGSNGKTTTTELIRAAAVSAGKTVVCNSEGSNQIEGVTAALLKHCNLKGEIKADAVILESDERFCQYTFSHFAPSHMVVTNLYRDQLTRNGNSEFVLAELKKGIPESTILILNADEPVSASLGFGRDNVIWYGVDRYATAEPAGAKHAYDDGGYCPICKARMHYDWRIEAHLGGYCCEKCGFRRLPVAHSVTAIAQDAITLDGKYTLRPFINNLMSAYNLTAAFTAAVDAIGVDPDAVVTALDAFQSSTGRVRTFEIDGHEGLFMLSKHENSMAYNGALRTIAATDADEKTVVLIVDLLSRKYIANDMSWLWDIDFDLLADARVKRIVIGGRFADDVACRLLFAGVDPAVLTVLPDLDEMMDSLYENPVGDLYLLTCFTDVNKFTKRLREGKKS